MIKEKKYSINYIKREIYYSKRLKLKIRLTKTSNDDKIPLEFNVGGEQALKVTKTIGTV